MLPEGLVFEALVDEDLDEVVAIEKEWSATPWSRPLFSEELKQPICYWHKLRDLTSTQRVAGYMGFWKAVDEAHITNLALRKAYHGRGLGRALVSHMLEIAKGEGCLRATLEVRPSNAAALKLYEKLGFTSVALRPRYYLDNGEDALILWKNEL